MCVDEHMFKLTMWKVVFVVVTFATLVKCHGGHGQEEDVAKPDKEHIKEHLKEQADMDMSKMSEEELEFYHFKLHDADNNTALDGLEIYKAIRHQVQESTQGHDEKPMTHEEAMKKAKETEDATSTTVDTFMKSTDVNDDGYVSFIEYKMHMAQLRSPNAKPNEEM